MSGFLSGLGDFNLGSIGNLGDFNLGSLDLSSLGNMGNVGNIGDIGNAVGNIGYMGNGNAAISPVIDFPVSGNTAGSGFDLGDISGIFKDLDMKEVGGLLSGLGGLGKAYMGYKAYGLGEDQLDLQRRALNRDAANQATAYNTRLQNIYDAWMRLNPEGMRQTREEYMADRRMDGSKVG